MPKISYSIGFTLHLGNPQNNEYIKMNVEVSDIDLEADVDTQIQLAHEGFHKLAEWGEEQINLKLDEALGKK